MPCGDGWVHFIKTAPAWCSTSRPPIVQNFSLFVDFLAAFFSIFVDRLVTRSGHFPNWIPVLPAGFFFATNPMMMTNINLFLL